MKYFISILLSVIILVSCETDINKSVLTNEIIDTSKIDTNKLLMPQSGEYVEIINKDNFKKLSFNPKDSILRYYIGYYSRLPKYEYIDSCQFQFKEYENNQFTKGGLNVKYEININSALGEPENGHVKKSILYLDKTMDTLFFYMLSEMMVQDPNVPGPPGRSMVESSRWTYWVRKK